MPRLITFALLFVAFAMLLTPAISVAANDGEALPIYPHTNKDLPNLMFAFWDYQFVYRKI